MSIGRVRNTRLAQIAKMLLILSDLLIPILQAQYNYILIMDIPVTETINLDPSLLKQLSPAGVVVVTSLTSICPQHRVLNPHLFDPP